MFLKLRRSCELRGSCDANGADFLYVYREDMLVFMAKYRDSFPYLYLAADTEIALLVVGGAADPQLVKLQLVIVKPEV